MDLYEDQETGTYVYKKASNECSPQRKSNLRRPPLPSLRLLRQTPRQ